MEPAFPNKDTKIAFHPIWTLEPLNEITSVKLEDGKNFQLKKVPRPRPAHLLGFSQEDGQTIKPLLRLVERRRADIVWELLDVSWMGGVKHQWEL